jgi:hypothetical protein
MPTVYKLRERWLRHRAAASKADFYIVSMPIGAEMRALFSYVCKNRS